MVRTAGAAVLAVLGLLSLAAATAHLEPDVVALTRGADLDDVVGPIADERLSLAEGMRSGD